MGKWTEGVKKPYVDHKTGKDSKAERFVSQQKLVFSVKNEKPNFNLRKISELPYNLIKVSESLSQAHDKIDFK